MRSAIRTTSCSAHPERISIFCKECTGRKKEAASSTPPPPSAQGCGGAKQSSPLKRGGGSRDDPSPARMGREGDTAFGEDDPAIFAVSAAISAAAPLSCRGRGFGSGGLLLSVSLYGCRRDTLSPFFRVRVPHRVRGELYSAKVLDVPGPLYGPRPHAGCRILRGSGPQPSAQHLAYVPIRGQAARLVSFCPVHLFRPHRLRKLLYLALSI